LTAARSRRPWSGTPAPRSAPAPPWHSASCAHNNEDHHPERPWAPALQHAQPVRGFLTSIQLRAAPPSSSEPPRRPAPAAPPSSSSRPAVQLPAVPPPRPAAVMPPTWCPCCPWPFLIPTNGMTAMILGHWCANTVHLTQDHESAHCRTGGMSSRSHRSANPDSPTESPRIPPAPHRPPPVLPSHPRGLPSPSRPAVPLPRPAASLSPLAVRGARAYPSLATG
jgi:hypothetical protein